MYRTLVVLALLLFFGVYSYAQDPVKAESPPQHRFNGQISMPENFVYESRRGIDSYVGVFLRNDGFVVSHDIGRMAGNLARQYFPEHFDQLRKQTHLNQNTIDQTITLLKEKVVWRRRIRIEDREILIVMLKDAKIIASIPNEYSNFFASVDTDDKLADFMLLVLSYRSRISN